MLVFLFESMLFGLLDESCSLFNVGKTEKDLNFALVSLNVRGVDIQNLVEHRGGSLELALFDQALCDVIEDRSLEVSFDAKFTLLVSLGIL